MQTKNALKTIASGARSLLACNRGYARVGAHNFPTTTPSEPKRSSFVVSTVFGCTGYTGKYIVNELAKKGLQVITPYKLYDMEVRDHRCLGDVGQIVEYKWDNKNYDSYLEICSASNVVVCSVGKFFDKYFTTMEECNLDIPIQIAKACAETGVKRLIFLSHLGADPAHESRLLRLKGIAEEKIRNVFPDVTILRPAPLFGYEDRLLNHIARCIRVAPGVPYVNGGANKFQPVWVANLADAVIACLDEPASRGQTYEITGPKEYTWTELVDYVAKTINEPLYKYDMPTPVLKAAGYVNEFTFRPVYTRDWVVRSQYDMVKDPNALGLEELGIQPESIDNLGFEFLQRWKRSGYFLNVNFKD